MKYKISVNSKTLEHLNEFYFWEVYLLETADINISCICCQAEMWVITEKE